MLKKFTCIICPNGCDIDAEVENNAVMSMSGNQCKKGMDYVKSEVTDPVRNFATSISVLNGEIPLCSVRLTGPIPKARIFDAVREIKKHSLSAPVRTGQVVVSNLLDLGVDVIATKEIEKQV